MMRAVLCLLLAVAVSAAMGLQPVTYGIQTTEKCGHMPNVMFEHAGDIFKKRSAWRFEKMSTKLGDYNRINYDGLRVKFGWSDALADMQYFFNIPWTIRDVETEGWRRTERPKGPMKELRMYCPPGRVVCPLYDTAGFVAGLQIAIPDDAMDSDLKPEKTFVKWTAPAAEGEPSREYWTASQYFVSTDSLKAGAGPTVENGATLQDGGVWVNGVNGKLMKIPLKESDLKNTLYKKQNCIPNMGTHYYYNVTKEGQCEAILPWFVMVSKGEVLGVGFQTFGRQPRTKHRQWFEDVPKGRTTTLLAVPHAPECYLDMYETYGLLSIHIYYINEPWNIKCESGDSIDPAPVMDRLALSGYRYANQIGDGIKKLMSG